MKEPQPEFKPYISPTQNPREFSVVAILCGILLAVVFGGANAYLGLRVGMTISASIPAAVISMIVLRVLLRRKSILENNLVQTIASAGESLTAGVIFTVPAFYLWEEEGTLSAPSFSAITLLALFGGVLGVLFMIPLRHYLIVREHRNLTYPEGRACAQVLLSAENNGNGGKWIFYGAGLGALIKFLIDGLNIAASSIKIHLAKLHTEFAVEPYPALLGVGYICGAKVAATLVAGSLLSWFVLIPLIVFAGSDGNAADPIAAVYAAQGASGIWSKYIRYIGAGAVAAGGIIGLIKALPVICVSFVQTLKGANQGADNAKRTEKDLNGRLITGLIVLIFCLLVALPNIPLNFGGVLLFMICGFFFATVASRIVGVIGSSNSPCSGMTIAALIISAFILKKAGISGTPGMLMALSIATMCCIITAIAGDTSQDLKTGFLLGATPWKQQLGELVGVLFSAFCIGGIVILLNRAWGFGSPQLPAPQAHLMKLVTEGVMQDKMSWDLILIGGAIALIAECLGVSPLCVAIGVFLPLGTTFPVFLGGIVRYLVDRKQRESESGVLFSSGLIAGEGLMGIILALGAVLHLNEKINLSAFLDTGALGSGSFIILIMLFTFFCCPSGKNAKKA